jgi:hypothetical protein
MQDRCSQVHKNTPQAYKYHDRHNYLGTNEHQDLTDCSHHQSSRIGMYRHHRCIDHVHYNSLGILSLLHNNHHRIQVANISKKKITCIKTIKITETMDVNTSQSLYINYRLATKNKIINLRKGMFQNLHHHLLLVCLIYRIHIHHAQSSSMLWMNVLCEIYLLD